jgi:hypothetical protein
MEIHAVSLIRVSTDSVVDTEFFAVGNGWGAIPGGIAVVEYHG